MVLVDSLHYVFARALLSHLEPAMFVMGIGTVEVGVFGLVRNKLSLDALRQNVWFFLAIGFLVGVSTLLTFTAVNYIDPGTGSMLGKLATLFSLGIGVIWLRERLTARQVVGALLSFVGVVIIAFQPGEFLRLGSIMVVTSALLYALHAALVKRHGGRIDFLNFFFMRLLTTTLFIAVYVLSRPSAGPIWPQANGWVLLLVAGTVDVVISRSLYYLALRRLPMTIHAIILTLSPAATLLWSLALFDTFPQPQQLLGGVTVLAGVLIAILGHTRSKL